MDVPFDCPFTKEEALEAINNLVKYFQNKEDGDCFGLDDLGIIEIYLLTH